MHAPFTRGNPENICQLYQHGEPIDKIGSYLGIIHVDVCGTPRVVSGCRELGGVSVCSTKGHFPLLRHQVNRTKALSSEAAELRGTIAFECHRRDKRRLSSSVRGAVSVLQPPTHPTHTL